MTRFVAVDGRRTRLSPSERFWGKVERGTPDSCWLWRGAIGTKGYGRLRWNGGTAIASRVAYELTFGVIGDRKIFVCHTCDVPACCNPAHMFLGAAIDNEHDKQAKGRDRKAVGERAPTAKMTEAQVREIRHAWDTGAASQSALGRQYGLRACTVGLIVHRQTWRHVA